jgi:hypothetical protein
LRSRLKPRYCPQNHRTSNLHLGACWLNFQPETGSWRGFFVVHLKVARVLYNSLLLPIYNNLTASHHLPVRTQQNNGKLGYDSRFQPTNRQALHFVSRIEKNLKSGCKYGRSHLQIRVPRHENTHKQWQGLERSLKTYDLPHIPILLSVPIHDVHTHSADSLPLITSQWVASLFISPVPNTV